MEGQQHQKLVNVAYLIFSGLVAFILLSGMMKLSDTYDLESKVKSIEYVIRGLSLGVGGLLFLLCYRNPKVNGFMNEVASELLTKVTWPLGKDTLTATVIVMITVIIAGLVLAFFDWVFTVALRWVL